MRVWFLADTHFGYKSDNDTWLKDYYDYFNQVYIPFVKKNYQEGDILVHLGDVFDNRSTVGIKTFSNVVDIFEQLGKIFKDIRIIVGNHDIFNKSTNDVTLLQAFKYIPNVKVYFEPTTETINGKKILFMPWIENVEDAHKLLEGLDVDYVFTHADIFGAKLVKGNTNTKKQTLLRPVDFGKAEVYAGHIHIRQDMKNVHYVGNPYHKDRGDIGNRKGITVIELETGKSSFVENKFSPKYLRENIYDILDCTIEDLKTRWKNNRIDLHILSPDIIRIKTDDMTNALKGVYKEIKVFGDPDYTTVKVDETEYTEAKTQDEYMSDWFESMDCSNEDRVVLKEMIKGYRDRL